MQNIKQLWRRVPTVVRKLLVTVLGTGVIVVGIALLVLPGPGWLVIFVGLAILATEFPQAQKIKDWIISRFKSAFAAASKKSPAEKSIDKKFNKHF